MQETLVQCTQSVLNMPFSQVLALALAPFVLIMLVYIVIHRKKLFIRKSLAELLASGEESEHKLRRVLGAWDLIAIGIGCIIGVGIFVVTGQGAAIAGPAVILSFVLAGIACAASALCYAEMASMIPISGSAYTYAYACFGELLAWIIGWDLILEYTVAAGFVSSGWSGYLMQMLHNVGVQVPKAWTTAALNGGIIDLPAVLIVLVLSGLLIVGIKESAAVNKVIVVLKLGVIVFVICLGTFYISGANFSPFMPKGWLSVVEGGALMFIAFIGFDAVSTTAEEARNPQRDLPIGIIGSLVVCTILYMAVAFVLTGMVPVLSLDPATLNTFIQAPIAWAFANVGHPWASSLIAAGAIAGITSVLFVLLMGQPRILFAISRDGLLPRWTSKTHPRFQTPYITTIITCVIVALLGGLVPIQDLAYLVNIGTLLAFVLVCLGVWVLRFSHPEYKRGFRVPLIWLVAPIGIISCLGMMASLPMATWIRLVVWLILGLLIFFGYGYSHSMLRLRRG